MENNIFKSLVKTVFVAAGFVSVNAAALTCDFGEGPVSYSIEFEAGHSAVVMYGQVGATGDGFELPYSGTGPGGAGIYQNQNGYKLFALNQGNMMNFKLLDMNQGVILFQDKLCKDGQTLDPKAVAGNVEKAIAANTTISMVVSTLAKSEGMNCKVSKGQTQVVMKTEKNEDYNYTYEVNDFMTSMECADLQQGAYAGRIDLTGSFSNGGNEVRLKSLSVDRSAN